MVEAVAVAVAGFALGAAHAWWRFGWRAPEEPRAAAPEILSATWMGRDPVSFPARSGEALLAAAQRAGVVLPSGCQRGVCGACRVRVLTGSVEQEGARALSAAQRSDGLALACVARCRTSITFEEA